MAPNVGTSNPASIRSKVVLPQPDGPSSEKNSPRLMSKLTSSTARTGPNSFETFLSEMMESAAVMGSKSAWFGCLDATTAQNFREDDDDRRDHQDGAAERQ